MTPCRWPSLHGQLFLAEIQGLLPARRRVVGAERGQGYSIQNGFRFRHILCNCTSRHTFFPLGPIMFCAHLAFPGSHIPQPKRGLRNKKWVKGEGGTECDGT
jgi:hypothetical protein